MKKDYYIYPAIFDYADDGISISFPDLPGCFSCANTDEEALFMAKNALGLHICNMEDDGDEIPVPTVLKNIKAKDNQKAVLIFFNTVGDRKSTRLNSSHPTTSRMPSSA